MVETGKTPVEALSYEQAFSELETVVEDLEREEHTLEEALALYARGQALLQRCRQLLEEAELKVRQLVDGEGVPLSVEEGE